MVSLSVVVLLNIISSAYDLLRLSSLGFCSRVTTAGRSLVHSHGRHRISPVQTVLVSSRVIAESSGEECEDDGGAGWEARQMGGSSRNRATSAAVSAVLARQGVLRSGGTWRLARGAERAHLLPLQQMETAVVCDPSSARRN